MAIIRLVNLKMLKRLIKHEIVKKLHLKKLSKFMVLEIKKIFENNKKIFRL